jgi:[acyl-carrier-protein] S-malonyltransferase
LLNPLGHGLGGHSTGHALALATLVAQKPRLRDGWAASGVDRPTARLGSGSVFAVVFPGQGSQFVGMADPWVSHPASAAVLDEASSALERSVPEGCRDEAMLATTEFVQPALLACGVGAFRVLEAEGLAEVVGVGGHSLGEYAALVAADVMTLTEALGVVAVRGAAMQRAGEERPGTMAALLGIGGEDVQALVDEAREGDVLVVANLNSPVQVVVSGSVAAVGRLEAIAKQRKVRAVRLPVAGAFHSPLMEPAVAAIDARLDPLDFRAPRFSVAENVTGSLVDDPDELKRSLRRQVTSPVRWEDCARALAAVGATTFLEAGAGDVLARLQKRIDPGVAAFAVGSPDAAREAIAG